MPRTKQREAMVLFLDKEAVPPTMKGGKGSLKVVVLSEAGGNVTLQHDAPKKGRGKGVMRTTLTLPASKVVLYDVEAIDAAGEAVEAPEATKTTRKRGPKKAAKEKKEKKAKKSRKSADSSDVVATVKGALGADPMGMSAIKEATGLEPTAIRPALAELEAAGEVTREGERRATVYFLSGGKKAKKAKKEKKEKVKKGKKAKAKKAADEEPTGKKVKKGKKGKKGKKEKAEDAAPKSTKKKAKKAKKMKKSRFGSSRRKSQFKLDPEDE